MRKSSPLIAGLLVLVGAAFAPQLLSAQQSTCPLGFTVAFFNGVGNTYGNAVASMHATQAAIQESQSTTNDVYDSEDVQYEVMYNTTASQAANVFDPVNTTILQDVAEVFVQRAQELDPTGTVGTNFFYMFWEWNEGAPQNYSNSLSNNSATNNFFANFVNAAVTAAAGALANLYGSQAPTAADYGQQEAQLTADAAAGRKLLLVAHSQGNLFVNHGYDFILPVVSAARVKVVHVAPASVTLRGDYELSTGDLVINGLRLVNGFASIVDPNISPPFTSVDPSGHGYTEIYLSAALTDSNTQTTDRALLEQKFVAALVALDSQQCAMSITPPTSTVSAGAHVTLNAILTPPVNAANLESITYKWAISGNAGGTFSNPVLGNEVPSLTTTAPTITYNASSAAISGQADAVTVEVDISTVNNNNATTKALAATTTNPAQITIGSLNATLTPQNPTVAPGSVTPFSVTVQGTVPTGISYVWTLVGTGSIGSGGPVTTTAATINYTAPTSGTDTLSVSLQDSGGNVLATSSTTITVNPWVGTWAGSLASDCGYYAGPLTYVITSGGGNVLEFALDGFPGYSGTYTGNSAVAANGEVVFTLSGNTFNVVEADSCQSGTFTRQ
jgi:hypothetical protein